MRKALLPSPFLTIFLISLFVNSAFARTWETIEIPDGKCGDGSNYAIRVSPGDPRKLAFYFEGGGACWNYSTCWGPIPFNRNLKVPEGVSNYAILSEKLTESPIADYTIVYFPYCTGDLFAGKHTANYGHFWPAWMHHWGATNVEAGIKRLTNYIAEATKSIVVYGVSAGAMGTIFNLETLNNYIGDHDNKVVILDSPVLHFASSKFGMLSQELLNDFKNALRSAGLEYEFSDSPLAKQFPSFCGKFKGWRIGILQPSHDIVLSFFGGMWPQTHANKVFGDEGIYRSTGSEVINCSSWVPSTWMHTFLLFSRSSRIEAEGITALQYAKDVIEGRNSGISYRE